MQDEERTRIALRAARDLIDGKQITEFQQRELEWLKEKWFVETSKELPKKVYKELTGLFDSQLDRMDSLYGIPTKGYTLDLARVLIGFHKFIADHGRKIKQVEKSRVAKEDAEQRMLDIKIRKAELDLAERSNKLIDRELVRRQLTWLAKQFSNMAEEIGRNHGPKPQESINEFLASMQREIESGNLM
jgi:organic radical activating enzyme